MSFICACAHYQLKVCCFFPRKNKLQKNKHRKNSYITLNAVVCSLFDFLQYGPLAECKCKFFPNGRFLQLHVWFFLLNFAPLGQINFRHSTELPIHILVHKKYKKKMEKIDSKLLHLSLVSRKKT